MLSTRKIFLVFIKLKQRKTKMDKKIYLNLYWNWLAYQFNSSDELHITLIYSWVKNFIEDDQMAIHWSKRDNWTVYYMGKDYLNSKSVERFIK